MEIGIIVCTKQDYFGTIRGNSLQRCLLPHSPVAVLWDCQVRILCYVYTWFMELVAMQILEVLNFSVVNCDHISLFLET